MDINSVKKFRKVELLLKSPNNTNSGSISKVEFEDAGLIITGDHLIVITQEKNNITSTGKIFNLKEIFNYRTYAI